jgi:hypothetical protein
MTINKEDDFGDLHTARIILELSGLLRKTKGRFFLTKKYQQLICISYTASEFLLFQTQENNKPDYYVLHPKTYGHLSPAGMIELAGERYNNKKWAKMGSHRKDSFTIDFGYYFPPYKVFGNEAIAEIINSKKL